MRRSDRNRRIRTCPAVGAKITSSASVTGTLERHPRAAPESSPASIQNSWLTPVKVRYSEVVSSTTTLEVTTPSGYRVAVAPGFDGDHLRRVLQTLAAAC